MTWLRKLHLFVGIILALPLLLQAVTGFLLRAGIITSAAYGLHTWSWIWRHIAFILAPALAFLAVSGVAFYMGTLVRKRRKRAAARGSAGRSGQGTRLSG